MKILLLAPHPFFQERGTPIAAKLLCETLCSFGYEVDMLTYHEGSDIKIKGLRIFRIPKIFFVKNIPIGLSWKKIVSDLFLSFYFLRMLISNNYSVIHSIEESIFPAAILNIFFRKKLIYDMDSSLADQLIERREYLKNFRGFFEKLESLAVRSADIVVPVCSYLSEKAKRYDTQKKVFILEDIAFEKYDKNNYENIRKSLDIKGVLAVYIGNLEHYQGIDLLLESVERINTKVEFAVVIIGGKPSDISNYEKLSNKMNIEKKVYFIGTRPFADLPLFLEQAEILLSPRLKGKNTPLKLFSYLASGKPVLATEIESHLQVVDETNSKLAAPNPSSFSKAFVELIENEDLRSKLGEAGKILAKNNYSLECYTKKLKNIYSQIVS